MGGQMGSMETLLRAQTHYHHRSADRHDMMPRQEISQELNWPAEDRGLANQGEPSDYAPYLGHREAGVPLETRKSFDRILHLYGILKQLCYPIQKFPRVVTSWLFSGSTLFANEIQNDHRVWGYNCSPQLSQSICE
ncbi:hypothetical protein CRG98_016619 [Punica granatum]|uniref:Uncharacterized protein n=1 Tax=Punica granatum TaxID=22663 RepID=A0A2I0K4A9_PUNGR|nr:hypothetical protein CRG98_016619 [Punica granatum]